MQKVSDALLFAAADLMGASTNAFERSTSLAKAGRMIDSHLVGAAGWCQFVAGKALGCLGIWLSRES